MRYSVSREAARDNHVAPALGVLLASGAGRAPSAPVVECPAGTPDGQQEGQAYDLSGPCQRAAPGQRSAPPGTGFGLASGRSPRCLSPYPMGLNTCRSSCFSDGNYTL